MGKRVGTVVLCVLLQGCSLTLPVKGQAQGSPETFSGTAAHYPGGAAGSLRLVSSRGPVCAGRSGPFQVASTGYSGSGFGDLDGERFTFTYGNE